MDPIDTERGVWGSLELQGFGDNINFFLQTVDIMERFKAQGLLIIFGFLKILQAAL